MAINPKDLNIAFFGTPAFAVHVLDELAASNILPTLLITAPDRPAGRGMQMMPPPVKVWAEAHSIDLIQPESLSEPEAEELLLNTEWDLFIVASYGKILSKELVEKPRFGTLNVHPSLLPKLRGASPVRSAILADAPDVVGVTIIKLDEKMDHGPIVAQASVALDPADWPPKATLLEEMLAHAGGELLAETISAWVAGEIVAEEQDHTAATFCKKIVKEDGLLDLSGDPWQNYLKIRGLDGWPGTYFFENGKRVKVTDADFTNGELTITRVTPEGKKEMDYEAFRNTPTL